jgi:hypothetical protein
VQLYTNISLTPSRCNHRRKRGVALQWYDLARSLEPASCDAIVGQGFVHLLIGHADQAITLFHEVGRAHVCVLPPAPAPLIFKRPNDLMQALSLAPHESLVQRLLSLAMAEQVLSPLQLSSLTQDTPQAIASASDAPPPEPTPALDAALLGIFANFGFEVEISGAGVVLPRDTRDSKVIQSSSTIDDIIGMGIGLPKSTHGAGRLSRQAAVPRQQFHDLSDMQDDDSEGVEEDEDEEDRGEGSSALSAITSTAPVVPVAAPVDVYSSDIMGTAMDLSGSSGGS